MNKVITISSLYAAMYAWRLNIELKNFKSEEFGIWWPLMNEEFLLNLDALRAELNAPIIISPAVGSLGRVHDLSSQHFPFPSLACADVMFPESDLYDVYKTVRKLELFHGIGVYKDWLPYHGMHLDMRADKTGVAPALWSGFKNKDNKQIYGGIDRGTSFA